MMAAKRKQTPIKPPKPKADGAGRGGVKPPAEHYFNPGNKAAVGHGRPRTIGELREYIQKLGEQPSGHPDLTRLDVLLRSMFGSKNAADRANMLKYGWGNVPQPIGGSAELGPIQIEAIEAYSYDAAVAAIAARPDENSIDAAQDTDGGDGAALG